MSQENSSNIYNYIELPCPDAESLAASKQFFQQLLGWKFKDWGDSYADTADSGVASGLAVDQERSPATPLPVLYVRDLEHTLQQVIDTGGTITKEIFSFPGGRRFHFREPSGNELAAWSDK